MIPKTLAGAVGAALAAGAFAADVSAPTFIRARPDESSFWRTASPGAMPLAIDFPAGATSATLAVRSLNYSRVYEDITSSTFALTLPAAVDLTKEDVYELTLTFNDGTVRTARLGMLAGSALGAEGTTRCCADTSIGKWRTTYSHGVMPVPHGTTSFTVGGEEIADGDAGFTGAQGWYVLPNLAPKTKVAVALTANGESFANDLTVIRNPPGATIIVR